MENLKPNMKPIAPYSPLFCTQAKPYSLYITQEVQKVCTFYLQQSYLHIPLNFSTT